jgi:hypothetical protein
MCPAINNLLLSIPRGPDKRSVREHNLRAAAVYGIISLQSLKCVEVGDNPGDPLDTHSLRDPGDSWAQEQVWCRSWLAWRTTSTRNYGFPCIKIIG